MTDRSFFGVGRRTDEVMRGDRFLVGGVDRRDLRHVPSSCSSPVLRSVHELRGSRFTGSLAAAHPGRHPAATGNPRANAWHGSEQAGVADLIVEHAESCADIMERRIARMLDCAGRHSRNAGGMAA
ncbi:MAG: hypothetical protein ABI389_14380 [Rhodanobacter sp.]